MSKELSKAIEDRIEHMRGQKEHDVPHSGVWANWKDVSVKDEAAVPTERDIALVHWELTRLLHMIEKGRIDVDV